MKTELLVLPKPATITPPRSKATRSTVLEQLLNELTAIAFGHQAESSMLDPNAFERWEGDETTYLETTIEAEDLPEIDLSTRDGKVLIRVLWPSDESDDDPCDPTDPDRGASGVYSAR
jgi:hypothetical protein